MRRRRGAARLALAAALGWATMPAVRAQETVLYTYDVLGRLKSACFVEAARLITWTYDAAGNRNSVVTAATTCSGGGAPNQPPQAVDDVKSGTYFNFDTVEVNILANDSDPDGDPLTITEATCLTGGCIVFINGGTLTITGTTEGTKSVSYTISDGRGGTDSATATLSSFSAPPGCEGFEICL